jgi:hypothetical protein
MHQQLRGYKVEEKLYVGLREQKRLNTTGLDPLHRPIQRLVNSQAVTDNVRFDNTVKHGTST